MSNYACYCQSGACRPVVSLCGMSQPSGLMVRDTVLQRPDQIPFLGRDFAQTTSRPLPMGGSWGTQVEVENELLNFQNREMGGAINSTKGFTIPLSWSLSPLVHEWQQPDNYAWHQEHSRQDVKDVCRPVACDSLEGRNTETRACPNAYFDCNRRACVSQMNQRRTTLL